MAALVVGRAGERALTAARGAGSGRRWLTGLGSGRRWLGGLRWLRGLLRGRRLRAPRRLLRLETAGHPGDQQHGYGPAPCDPTRDPRPRAGHHPSLNRRPASHLTGGRRHPSAITGSQRIDRLKAGGGGFPRGERRRPLIEHPARQPHKRQDLGVLKLQDSLGSARRRGSLRRVGHRGGGPRSDRLDHDIAHNQQQRGKRRDAQDRPSTRHPAKGTSRRAGRPSRLAGPADLRLRQKQAEQRAMSITAPAIHPRPPQPRFSVADALGHAVGRRPAHSCACIPGMDGMRCA